MRFSAHLDIFLHGLLHLFKDAGVVAGGLTGIHNAVVKCLFVVSRSCIHRFLCVPTGNNAEDSNLVSMKAMQWVLLYLPLVMIGGIENISRSMNKMTFIL
jgi:hypothetical protein